MKFSFLLVAALMAATLFSSAHAQVPVATPSFAVQVAAPAASPTPSVLVAAPAAPPQWAQDIMVTAQKLPVIGPIVSKALFYLGIISSLLTLLVGFLLGAINTVSAGMKLAKLEELAQVLLTFKDGKVMYWIKYFSMFNAQKMPPNPPSA